MSAVLSSLPPSRAVRETPRAAETGNFSLTIESLYGFAQVVDFKLQGVPLLATDEPAPVGKGRGPNPAQLLAAAIGSCLGASLLFCLQKARVDVKGLQTVVEGTLVRNGAGRLRIGSIRVRLSPQVDGEDAARVARCRELFEDFCIVTQSVREGLDVEVTVGT
jgi:organic hydroperoxide reductase OsmC/OhrA